MLRSVVERGLRLAVSRVAAAGLASRAVASWRRLLDVSQTSVRVFLESYQVQTKRVDALSGSVLVDFRERAAQTLLREEIERQWALGRGAKILILKDRQQGLSTVVQLLMWERLMRGGGGKGKVVSHKDEATEELFETLDSFKNQTPDAAYKAVGAKLVKASARAVKIKFGTHLTSSAQVMTAGDAAMGRGGAVRWLHISEYPWWSRGKRALGGLLSSWEDAPGNFVIIESTANGLEEFYRMWGKAERGLSDYVPMFFSWLTHPHKALPFRTKRRRELFEESVGTRAEYGVEEELILRDQHGATLEQLHWRRREIDSPGVDGDLGFFKQEHPATPGEAFQSSSRSLFPLELLNAWREKARQMDADARVGSIVKDGKSPVEFMEERRGGWRIYREPEIGKCYAYGSDVAEGKEVLAGGGGQEGDLSTVVIREIQTKRIAAVFRAHVDPETLALEVAKGSELYGMARGYVERNNHGHTTLHVLETMEYSEIVLTQIRLLPGAGGRRWTYEPGFKTKQNTKGPIIDRARKWVRDLGVPKEDSEPAIPLCLLEEQERFVRMGPGASQMGAEVGHDDLVMADALCLEACWYLRDEVAELPVVERVLESPYMRWLEATTYSVPTGLDSDLGAGF